MSNDIGDSKENILLIEKGRNPKAMRSALKPCLEDEFSQIQREFKEELRTYEGNDPLSVWIKYITCIDQHFIKCGHKGNLSKLIQQCLANLVSEDQYIDDDRFIDIWLRFASMTKEPLIVYNTMYARNIACKAAKFYTAWAWELEQTGNLKRADEVLMEGIHRNAQPIEDIKSAHTHLEVRMVKTSERETTEPVTRKAERQALNALHTNNTVPIVRMGHSIIHPSNGNVPQPMPLGTSNSPLPFKIHSSENTLTLLSRNTDKPPDFALHTVTSKENDKKVTKWNKGKAKCCTEPSSTQFSARECENTPPPISACKVPQSPGILSSKKQSTPIALFEKYDPMKRSMYDKAKVYSGTEEFSFEEIRAAAYWKKKREQEEEESKKYDKLMILKLQEQMKILQEKVEQMTVTSQASEPKELGNTENHAPSVDEQPSMPKELSQKQLEHMSDQQVPTNVLNRAGESECSMLHELYNGTLNCYSRNNSNSESMHKNFDYQDGANCDEKIPNSNQKEAHQAFEFFRDATDVILPQPASRSIPIFSDHGNMNFQPPSVQKAQHQKTINEENATEINFENIPPPDYVQQHIKRDLVGILEPSKDIPFIPLEEQLKQQENDCNMNEDENDFNSCFATLPPYANEPMEDFSIGLNTERFAAAVVASTPFIKHAKESMVSQLAKSSCPSMPPPESTTVPVSIVKQCQDLAEGNFYIGAHSWKLNTINEMSNEGSSGYSKSSTSTSSNETTSKTKIGNHYSTSMSPTSSSSRHITRTSEYEESEHCVRSLPPTARIANVQQYQLYNSDVDPFDMATTNAFLNNLAVPMCNREKFHDFRNVKFSTKNPLTIGTMEYHFTESRPYATGSYAKVYSAQAFGDPLSDDTVQVTDVAIKECPKANEWELYICSELSSRLDQAGSPSVRNCIISIHEAAAFKNCLVFITNLYTTGTLLDMANTYKQKNCTVPEDIVLYMTYELLLIVSKVHSCGILHGDIKPDNFLLNKIPDISFLDSMDNEIGSLCLIDFGRAIDLTLYKPGVCFTSVVTTEGFQCIEMQENRPWVHQTDWYGVASCIHVLLFSDYLKVKKNATTGLWEPVSKFKRYWKEEFWHSLFTALLNVKNCYDKLDLQPFLDKIKELLRSQVYQFRFSTHKMLQLMTK